MAPGYGYTRRLQLPANALRNKVTATHLRGSGIEIRIPTVVAAASSDRTQLQRALEAVQADPAPAAWNAAFALATGAAQGFRDARIVIVSDGGLPDDLPPLPVEL